MADPVRIDYNDHEIRYFFRDGEDADACAEPGDKKEFSVYKIDRDSYPYECMWRVTKYQD